MAETCSRKTSNGNRFVQIMAKHPEICCIFLAILFTILSNYSKSNGSQHFAEQPGPKRFFPHPSPVLDYPRGNLVEVGDLLVDEEVLMVMYYAPWCSHSNRAKREFEKAASYLENQVQFVGINCWYPLGTCRKQNNFSSYPIFFLYHTTLDGFRYHGLLRADFMVQFVEQILYPLTPIHTREQLAMFVATNDNAVVGHFDFNESPQPPGYQQFYYASMRTLELDPRNPVSYGLISNPDLARTFEMNSSDTVFLLRSLNETLKYPESFNLTSRSITQWVVTLRQQPTVQWLLPTELKSLVMSTELVKGPALIMFIPTAPLAEINQFHGLLREIVLDYKNCNQSRLLLDKLHTSMLYRYGNYIVRQKFLEQCKKLRLKKPLSQQRPMRALPTKRCCASALFGDVHKLNSCDICLNYDFGHPMSARDCSVLSLGNMPSFRMFQSLMSFEGHPCSELMPNYNPGEFVSFCCDNTTVRQPVVHTFHKPHDAAFSGSTDPYVRLHTPNFLVENECQKLRQQRLNGWLPLSQLPEQGLNIETLSNFTGLGCDRNNSVNFYAMDIKQSGLFAKNLGIDMSGGTSNKSVIILVDIKNEVHYLLEDRITKANIAKFVENFTSNDLGRHLRSTHTQSDLVCSGPNSDICIQEVTTATFHETVMDSGKDVVLLYYAPWCGFCASFAHIYLALAKYFKSAKTILFARINADKHDLHWEFTADAYPTITIFPASRKAESVTLPDHLKKTLPNLVQFVLRYASRSLKMDTGLSVCSRTCIQENMHATAEQMHVLHKEIYDTQHRITQVEQRLQFHAAAAGRSESSDPAAGSSMDAGFSLQRRDLLNSYLDFLKVRLKQKELQREVVKGLHNTLLETTGFYIERHRLSSLLNLCESMHSKLRAELQSSVQDQESSRKSSQGHDEL